MKTREWLMTEERENLKLVMTELKGWTTQNVDMVLSVMAENGVYYDITGEP